MTEKWKLWVVLTLVLIFAAGVVGGVFLERTLISRKIKETKRSSPHFPTLEMMSRELNLTPEQEALIKDIFKQSEERLKALRGQLHKQLSEIRVQLKSDIDNVLTPEQRKRFEEMIERYLAQRKKEYEEKREKYVKDSQRAKDKGEMP